MNLLTDLFGKTFFTDTSSRLLWSGVLPYNASHLTILYMTVHLPIYNHLNGKTEDEKIYLIEIFRSNEE